MQRHMLPTGADHPSLLRELEEVDRLLQGDLDWGSTAPRIMALAERLLLHFDAEEAAWAAAETRTQHPRAATRIDRLVLEHHQMRGAVAALRLDSPIPPEAFRSTWSALAEQLRRHERAESTLLQDLLYDDIGGPG